MTTVVKIGGVLLENPVKAVEEIRRVAGKRAAIVHGGGIQITRMLERMNVQSTFIEGLRVTDEKTLDAVPLCLDAHTFAPIVDARLLIACALLVCHPCHRRTL